MIYYNKILFITDFSNYYDAAYEYAIKLTNLFNAHLHIFYYYSNITFRNVFGPEFLFAEYNRQLNIKYPRELEYYMKQYTPKYGLDENKIVKTYARGYSPKTSIIDYINQKKIDLVITGIHIDHDLRNILVRNTEREIIKTVPCDILVVKGKPLINNCPQDILVAINLPIHSNRLVLVGSYIAEKLESCLTLLHIILDKIPTTVFLDTTDILIDNIFENIERDTMNKLIEVARELKIYKKHKLKIIKGNVPKSISKYAQENGYALIIVGSQNDRKTSGKCFRSISEKILYNSSSSVLLVKN